MILLEFYKFFYKYPLFDCRIAFYGFSGSGLYCAAASDNVFRAFRASGLVPARGPPDRLYIYFGHRNVIFGVREKIM